jgi:hypothetical protein
MSMDAVKASAAEKKREHEAKLQRQILDWIEVVKPERGNILVLRVPEDKFIHPGQKLDDTTAEQRATMEAVHQVLRVVIDDLARSGVRMGGAAVLSETMKLEDLPPPPPEVREQIQQARSRILLPPGTKI